MSVPSEGRSQQLTQMMGFQDFSNENPLGRIKLRFAANVVTDDPSEFTALLVSVLFFYRW